MGTASYILSVLCLSYHDLHEPELLGARVLCLAIGVGSMLSVVMTIGALARDAPQRQG